MFSLLILTVRLSLQDKDCLIGCGLLCLLLSLTDSRGDLSSIDKYRRLIFLVVIRSALTDQTVF